jgi:MarR family transcriptional regulator, temperature-dependent positive regulator of motility
MPKPPAVLPARAAASLQALVHEGFVAYGQDRGRELLPIQEAVTVQFIGRLEPISMSELAASLGMLPNTMTGIVDRLVQRGYAERHRADNDRRIVMVKLTPKGHKQIGKQEDFLYEFGALVLQRLSPADSRKVVEILAKAAQANFME